MPRVLFRRLILVQGCQLFLLLATSSVGLLWLTPGGGMSRPILFWLGAMLVAGLALVAGSSFVLARHIDRPVADLIQAVDRLGDGQLHAFPRATDSTRHLVQAIHRQNLLLAHRISQLEEDRQQLRTILSGMVEGVIALDASQRVLFANARAIDLLGLSSGRLVGRHFWEVVRQRTLLDVVQRALGASAPQHEEIGWNGREARHLTVHAARLPGEPPRGAVVVLHDTTELRRLERLRQDFVANVSHELKTPLSVIKACVETLLDGAVEDAEHRGAFLRQVAAAADRLHALILDLLSLARIESGDEVFEFTAVPVEPVVRGLVARYRPRAEARRQNLEVAAPAGELPSAALAVWADEEAVGQILDNLLDNALKYTPEGGEVRVSWRRENGHVALEVSDTGIGIPEADLPRVFERFYRVDKARSRALGGTGLGLSIVKHLVQAMHGRVRAVSQPGRGSTFIVTLPREDPALAPTEDPVSEISLASSP